VGWGEYAHPTKSVHRRICSTLETRHDKVEIPGGKIWRMTRAAPKVVNIGGPMSRKWG